MADIVPSTTIQLFKGVPLDNSYSDTLYFSNVTAQNNYFDSISSKITIDGCSYQRANSKGEGVRKLHCIYVPRATESLLTYNYLRFHNSASGKWFYAFILSVNYINPNTTEILYEIDQIQTWFPNCTLKASFVEREHAATDTVFANLEPEPIEVGAYITGNSTDATKEVAPSDLIDNASLNKVTVTAILSEEVEGSTVAPAAWSGVYCGLYMKSVQISNAADMSSFLSGLASKIDSVVSVYMTPFSPYILQPHTANVFCASAIWSDFGGYLVRNKKLLNYPYRYIKMRSFKGEEINFQPELIPRETGLVVKFVVTGGASPEITAIPLNYAGQSENYNKAITYTARAECAWNGDVFKQWLDQNKVSLGIRALSDVLSGAAGTAALATGVGAQFGTLQLSAAGADLLKMGSEIAKVATLPDEAKGSVSGDYTSYYLGKFGYQIMQMTITPQRAEAIDQFFDMYGYATNRVKLPNITSRNTWNYIKTRDLVMDGDAPADAVAHIKHCFNNGIRFWHKASVLGDYTQDNSPVKVESGD